LTPSYAQTTSENDSTFCLSVNEGRFFIDLDSRVNFLELENELLRFSDSVNTRRISNYESIIDTNDSVIYYLGQIVNNKEAVINTIGSEVSQQNIIIAEKEQTIKEKNKTLLGTLIIIVVQAVIIAITL
jgi:hypothetical protein